MHAKMVRLMLTHLRPNPSGPVGVGTCSTFCEPDSTAPVSTRNDAEGRDRPSNFIEQIIRRDVAAGKHGGAVVTRFPPEPNGYLHIGHAKAICLNFEMARAFDGVCHLRFDDTNPDKEDVEYVNAIQRDVQWLGFDWGEKRFFASDYFEQLYQMALRLIEKGLAYVDSLSEEEIRDYRGTVTEPGRPSPYRDRTPEENLDLFRRMRAGEFDDGAHVLRAKIDMASPNMLLRDPVLYRIKHAHHYRSGDDWPIYPLYDFAHPLSDALEGITHSLCSLEFEVHRPLYDWLVEHLFEAPRPHQYEFARLNLDYTIMSKRKLLKLVEDGSVDGWDDPRMPTLAGMRRRGIPPEAIRRFCDLIGVAKADNRVDIGLFEYAIRDDLNPRAPRVMAVLDPLKVTLTNFPEGDTDWFDADYWPHDIPKEGTRKVPFTRTLYIERDDFMEEPTKKFFRLAPGREVRLRHAYIIRCEEVVKDASGEVVELKCTLDPASRSGSKGASRRVKGTLHWVAADYALPATIRLYDRLFRTPDPEDVPEGETFLDRLNPDSKVVLTQALVEPSVKTDPPGTRYQFERQGYFISDVLDSSAEALVFNRIVTLRDTWAKIAEKPAQKSKPKGHASRAAAEKTSGLIVVPVEPKPQPAAPKPPAPKSPAMAARMEALMNTYGLDASDADLLTTDAATADFFRAAVVADADASTVANWMNNELAGLLGDRALSDLPFGGAALARLLALIDDGTISARTAKDVLAMMVETGDAPDAIVEAQGLRQISDTAALEAILDGLMAQFPDKVAAYRSGKTGLRGFFVGQVMRATQGQANPQLVQQLVTAKLEG